MLLIFNRYFPTRSTSKIVFLLLIGILSFFVLQVQSCSSKKDKKIVYSLPQYPLTSYYLSLNKDSLEFIYKNFEEDIYIQADLKIGEQNIKGVKLRIRGDSSRKLDKKSLKIKLPKGVQLEDGAKKVNLNADYGDKTMMHQYLASKTMNDNGQLCFRSGYVPLYINNEFYGLYIRVENMDSDFLESRNLSSENNLYKATKDYSCLISTYEVDRKWEKKTNKNNQSREDLKEFIEDLNALSTVDFENFAKTYLFYDEMVNLIALNMLISNSSTYYHNYYMYHDLDKDKWRMLPWDMDKTFNPDHITYNYQKTAWAEGKSSGIHTNTLVEMFFANENTLQSIKNRIFELQNSFSTENYKKEIDLLRSQIQKYVFMDKTNKIKSKSTWNKNLNNLIYFIENRPMALLDQIDNKVLTFMVNREIEVANNSVIINWDKAIDPNKLPLTYTVHYAMDNDFKGDNYKKIEGLSTQQCKIVDLDPGKYFFFVSASNSKYITYGHDIRNSFVIP